MLWKWVGKKLLALFNWDTSWSPIRLAPWIACDELDFDKAFPCHRTEARHVEALLGPPDVTERSLGELCWSYQVKEYWMPLIAQDVAVTVQAIHTLHFVFDHQLRLKRAVRRRQ